MLNPPQMRGWGAVSLLFGLLVTVQGFETSRYLGEDYDPMKPITPLLGRLDAPLRGTDMVIERSTMTEIEVNTGGRFIAVPASGSTIRGYTATLIEGDEVAFWPGDNGGEDLLAAVIPMLTVTGQLFLASTPAGKNNYFASLFLNQKPGDNIHRIVVRGTDIPRMADKVERLRQTLSPTKFRQEVLVEMLSDGQSYFDLDCIAQATNPDVKAFSL